MRQISKWLTKSLYSNTTSHHVLVVTIAFQKWRRENCICTACILHPHEYTWLYFAHSLVAFYVYLRYASSRIIYIMTVLLVPLAVVQLTAYAYPTSIVKLTGATRLTVTNIICLCSMTSQFGFAIAYHYMIFDTNDFDEVQRLSIIFLQLSATLLGYHAVASNFLWPFNFLLAISYPCKCQLELILNTPDISDTYTSN